MLKFLKSLAKRFAAVMAALVIVLAIAVGAFRLLLPQLPTYQEQIKGWAEGALGMPVQFSRMDARWGLQGPELTFFDALIGEADTQTGALVAADQVRVGISLVALIASQQVSVNRVTLVGTSLETERLAPGMYRVQGLEFELPGAGPGLRVDQLPEFEVAIEDSAASFSDQLHGGTSWQFDKVSLTLEQVSGRVEFELQLVPPELLGGRVEVAANAVLGTGSEELFDLPWKAYLNLRDADLAGWSRLLADFERTPDEGRGDISLWLGFRDRQPAQGTVQASISGLVLPGQRLSLDNGDPYQQFRVVAEWQRSGNTWQISASDLSIQRQDRWWPRGELALVLDVGDRDVSRFELNGDFLRLEDLAPWQALVPDSVVKRRWIDLDPRGDLQDFAVLLERQPAAGWRYSGEARAANLTFKAAEGLPGLRNVNAQLRVDSTSGRVALDADGSQIAWPEMLADAMAIDKLEGVVVWRRSRDGLRIVGDDLVLSNAELSSRSSFELTLPSDDSSPILDLDTGIADVDIVGLKRYLPSSRLKPGVYRWLRQAWEGGRIPRAQVSFFGPIDLFPFENGEGQFRLAAELSDVQLRFVSSWPSAKGVSANVVVNNAAMEARVTNGALLGNQIRDARLRFADIRNGVLDAQATTEGPIQEALDFFAAAPVIAERLNPGLEAVTGPDGTLKVEMDLKFPILEPSAYGLRAEGLISDATLVVRGLKPQISDINGRVILDQTVFSSEALEGTFLAAPAVLAVAPAATPGFHTVLRAEGIANSQPLADAFPFPVVSDLSGSAAYSAEVLFPFGAESRPLEVRVSSDFNGMGLQLPAPLGIAPDETAAVDLRLVLQTRQLLQLSGWFDAGRGFAVELKDTGKGFEFQRGNVRLGGEAAALPTVDGLVVNGHTAMLRIDDWLDRFSNADDSARVDTVLKSVSLTTDEAFVFGQALGPAEFSMDRSGKEWLVQMDSQPVAGAIFVPFDLASRPQVTLEMERLNFTESVEAPSASDPRELPGFDVQAVEFTLDGRQFGSLAAEIRPDPRGLNAISFITEHPAFKVTGEGSWLVENDGPRTRAKLQLNTTSVGETLVPLGFDRLMEAQQGVLSADVTWVGSPTAGWMRTVRGEVTVSADNGTLNEIEPGAGRVFGLMSVAALPRRLALDFRDVFNKGLKFDSLSGTFILVDGDAYTDNLKFDGPSAEIGIVGRTGLREQDYQQQAIVTAKVGRTLPAVGGILAGPGVGAALLIFTEIFKKPLKGIGQASYCVTGSWEEPAIERLSPTQLQEGEVCADLLPSRATAGLAPVGGDSR